MGYFDTDGQPTEWDDDQVESLPRRESRLIREGHPLYVSPAGDHREYQVQCRRCARLTYAYRATCINCVEATSDG